MMTPRVPMVAAPPLAPLPFFVEVTYHRGSSCEHSPDRQCDPCFRQAMEGYDHIVPAELVISEYLREHKLKDISLVESFTWMMDPP